MFAWDPLGGTRWPWTGCLPALPPSGDPEQRAVAVAGVRVASVASGARGHQIPEEGVHPAGHSSAGTLLASPTPSPGRSLPSPPHCSVLVRPGAAVGPGGGQAAQERQRGHPRVRPRRPLQAGAVPPVHGLLLVRPGGHRPPHPRHVHQVSSGTQASRPPWTRGPEARAHPAAQRGDNARGREAQAERPLTGPELDALGRVCSHPVRAGCNRGGWL